MRPRNESPFLYRDSWGGVEGPQHMFFWFEIEGEHSSRLTGTMVARARRSTRYKGCLCTAAKYWGPSPPPTNRIPNSSPQRWTQGRAVFPPIVLFSYFLNEQSRIRFKWGRSKMIEFPADLFCIFYIVFRQCVMWFAVWVNFDKRSSCLISCFGL